MPQFSINNNNRQMNRNLTNDNYNSTPSLSIVIPVYNGGENFRSCLLSLQKYAPSDVEVLVVADGDTDGSRNLATEFGYRLLVNKNSRGPASARNRGAKKTSGEVIFFMDADVTINQYTIPKILDFFASHPDVDAIIGSYDDTPYASNFLSQYKNLFHHYTHQQGSEVGSTFWGACGIIRREAFLEVGGFNESYRLPSVEDIELGYRLRKAGFSIKLCKDIQVKHLKEWRIVSLLKAEIFQRAIPWTVLLLRYDQIKNDLNLGFKSRISIILVYSMLFFALLIWWWESAFFFLLSIAILLFILNIDVYKFYFQKKNILFSLLVIPWHWFYYFYGGVGFATGLAMSQLRKSQEPTI